MIDREQLLQRRRELSYVSGRFMTEHLIRVHQLFEGDLTAAVVLATVAQHGVQRYYEEIARDSAEGFDRLVADGAHVDHLRPCNALSVSHATGIPRETVRRKVRWLAAAGMARDRDERGRLSVVPRMADDFAEFDLETIERLHACSAAMQRVLRRAHWTDRGDVICDAGGLPYRGSPSNSFNRYNTSSAARGLSDSGSTPSSIRRSTDSVSFSGIDNASSCCGVGGLVACSRCSSSCRYLRASPMTVFGTPARRATCSP